MENKGERIKSTAPRQLHHRHTTVVNYTTDTQPKCMTPRLKPKAARDSSIDSSIERKNTISISKTKHFKSTKIKDILYTYLHTHTHTHNGLVCISEVEYKEKGLEWKTRGRESSLPHRVNYTTDTQPK